MVFLDEMEQGIQLEKDEFSLNISFSLMKKKETNVADQ